MIRLQSNTVLLRHDDLNTYHTRTPYHEQQSRFQTFHITIKISYKSLV